MSVTLSPNTQISVTLYAAQWNDILMQLAEGPYKIVAPLMQAIQQQCMSQAPDPNHLLPARQGGNGAVPPDPNPP